MSPMSITRQFKGHGGKSIFCSLMCPTKALTVESLQSHMILTMSHWSSGLTCLLPITMVTGSNPLGGTYVKPGFSC
jgi:hypothetical protein